MFNICLCDTEAGYTHKPECPYPLYGGTMDECQRWYAARDVKHLRDAERLVRRAIQNADGIPADKRAARVLGLPLTDDSAQINEALDKGE